MTLNLRIGIDVGGTFTHAVAVNNDTLDIIAHQVVPTSHQAPGGVAQGILESLSSLLASLPPHNITFLAHSTTQATNALLEGDVVPVAIIGIGKGLEGAKAKSDLELGTIELATGKHLKTTLYFLNPDTRDYHNLLDSTLHQAIQEGHQAAVAAQAFSVDDPKGELEILHHATRFNLPACATHEMSGLYGLKIRARTAVINASILPRMLDTARCTQEALLKDNIKAPLMVMRSDGGVMTLEEMQRRPVLTLLSGPAAGIAAALMFLNASDAFFLEVGGTSTDICLIHNGKAAIKSAIVGGHPTHLKTLDSRTLAVAGGSMIRRTQTGNLDLGPRSAHLAGYPYASFAPSHQLSGDLKIVELSPLSGDPPYLILENKNGDRTAVTLTCAANYLAYIKEGMYSYGNQDNLKRAFSALGRHLGTSPHQVADNILNRAVAKVLPTLKKLQSEYALHNKQLKLIGGGGGAGALVPFLGEKTGMPWEIAPRAEIISAIGASLAMVRESIERNIIDPTPSDLAELRNQAAKAVVKMGADPHTVKVTVEIDSRKNLVQATATGTVAFKAGSVSTKDVSEDKRLALLKDTAPNEDKYTLLASTDFYCVYETQRQEKKFFNLWTKNHRTLWVTDPKGNVKLQAPQALLQPAKACELIPTLKKILEEHTSYGDGGAVLPACHIIGGRKITNLTTLTTTEQICTLAAQELGDLPAEEPVFFIIHRSN